MNYAIFPQKDSTIYETTSSLNAGIDEILELGKFTTYTSRYNTRMLMKFDLTYISQSIVAGTISSPKYYLNICATEANEVPAEYTIYAYPVSESWTNGIGRHDHYPATVEGVSWKYKDGYSDGVSWQTSSYQALTTGSWATVAGGAVWYTSSVASQSYSYEMADIRMDVTDIVNDWISGATPNEGFILKRSDADEQSTTELGSVKYFSSNTHTIYSPKLEVLWDDSTFASGSLAELTDEDIVLYVRGLKREYKQESKAKIRVLGRAKYPTRTYSTSSAYRTIKYLPTSSYYEVRDAYTDHIVIPYDDDYTKLSCDSDGNYMRLWTNALYMDRHYKIGFKIVRDSGSRVEYFENDAFRFKVVK